MLNGMVKIKQSMMQTICRVVLPYVIFASLWIYLSDWLLSILVTDPATITQWSMYKGWAFVLVTALLLSVLLRVELSARARAEESLRRLAAAVEQAAETIMITDASAKILYVNPAFEKTTGYSRKESIGQNPRFLRTDKQDEAFYARMKKMLADGQVWSGNITSRRKDGSIYEEESTISPVRDAEGRIVNYVAVNRDVTREFHLEKQLMQARKMEVIGRLAGGVAHDFNNLLLAILGYSDMTLKALPPKEPLRKYVEEIYAAGERAAGLTRQLLAFSRKQVLQPKVLDLNGLISNLSKMLCRLISENIQLKTNLEPALGSAKADLGQMEQVITNLVVNARDSMPEGGTITIQTANIELDDDYANRHEEVTPGRYVLLTVTDTGMGMSKEVKEHLFEPFFTTKEQGKGTGLGLSTVYGIVKQSGGHITVISDVGCGTVFKIYLPRVDEATELASQASPSAEYPRGNETILLVEDEEQVRNLARMVLDECGYTVLVAGNGPDALRIARQNEGKIHLLMTDVVMPEMSGHMLAPLMVTMNPSIRVLYISGHTDTELARQNMVNSVSAFLQKPFSNEALARKVREVLDASAPK